MPIMGCFIDLLKTGATIHIATNLTWYQRECVDYMTKHWNLQLVKNSRVEDNSDGYQALTHFLAKTIQDLLINHSLRNLIHFNINN